MTQAHSPQEGQLSLRWQDLSAAADDGLLTPVQAQALWQRWSAGDLRRSGVASLAAHTTGPAFGFTNVLYYFGGMVAIGAMSLFMTLGFERMGAGGLLPIALAYGVACLKVADHFKARGLRVPAGILATLAVVLIPLALTVWYMGMDLANALMQNEGFDWQFTRDVSLLFGIATCALALWVDVRSHRSNDAQARQDYAFWLYLFGALMFWGGLSLRDSNSEWSKLAYCMLNVALVFGGALIGRRVFTVLGLGLVALGVWWQRHEEGIQARLKPLLPFISA